MSSKRVEAKNSGVSRRWAMTTWLTLYYTVAVFILLAAASAFLYWGLARNLLQQQQDYLRQKMQVQELLLERQPLDRAGLNQEAMEEAGVSGRSRFPFFLRVLDEKSRLVIETPGMASILPVAVFPSAEATGPAQRSWRSAGGISFLLSTATVSAPMSSSRGWRIQMALNVSADEGLLRRYRRDIAIVLVFGPLVAATMGASITRRGLEPLANITQSAEHIGVQQLQERIGTGPWPKELVSLAAAFDGMLDRLQESFERLSQFSADLAHELRNPINNLMGEAQVTLAHNRSPAEYARVLQSALEEHGRLARMIDSMLFLAQADRVRSVPAAIPLEAHAEMRAVADFYQALADEQGVELTCIGEGALVADPMLLRRAISNLLSNALKYTPRGGRVTLLLADAPHGSPTISVIDSGIGIASEHLPRLGDRFYRVDTSRTESPTGAGLGLAIVRSIMALHGGLLLIDSTVGRGTTVSLVFSASSARGVPPA